LLEIADGVDIVEAVAEFVARRRQRGVVVLSASGIVRDVTLRKPGTPEGRFTLHGAFEILSLSGSLMPSPCPPGASGLAVLLARGQGRVIGGTVVSQLVASGPVMVFAATFSNINYERLPLEDDEPAEVPADPDESPTGVAGEGRSLDPKFTSLHDLPPDMMPKEEG
jgi:predicted DNA-binding protein with PD1-like motif